MVIGHLEFLAIYDYETYETHKVIPVEIPLGHRVLATVTYHNDTEFARTMTCEVKLIDPDGASVGAKGYTNVWVPAYGHKTAATNPVYLNKAGIWKIQAVLDPALSPPTDWHGNDAIDVEGVAPPPPPPPSGWQEAGSIEFILIPQPLAGWQEVGSIEFELIPPEIPGNWQEVGSIEFDLYSSGVGPPGCEADADCSPPTPYCVGGVCVECRTDADCPEGYVCKNGACVKKEAVGFPWQWLLIAAGAIGGAALLLIPKKAKVKK